MPWKTDRTSPALEAVDGVVADGQRPLSVRTPTVTSWLTSSIMQIWGAHFLGRRVRLIPPGELPVASAHLAA